MEFKTFRHNTIFYLASIIVLSVGGVYILLEKYYWLVSFWIFIFDFFLIFLFLRYIQKEHQKLAYFISSVSQKDFSIPGSKNYSNHEINEAFKKLSDVVRSLRDEAEINYQYLQMIINQVDVVIICANLNNEIVLLNNAADLLLGKRKLKTISSLSKMDSGLPGVLNELKLNEKKIIKLHHSGEINSYSVQVAEFKIVNEKFRLFTINNIQSELEQNEIESWQKLTRVITHEIMNSAIPISNLSKLVYSQLYNENGIYNDNKNEEQKDDIRESLQTISNRSKALADFVKATKNFTKMPKPELEHILVSDLIKRVLALLKQKLKESTISVEVSYSTENISILADKSLIEQALINIVLNAIEALTDAFEPKIKIVVYTNDKNQTLISVSDNGKGIKKEILENIFIPFFTTKRNGSGIGLSLAKHIMLLHKGNLIVKSIPEEGSTFMFIF
jgi:two-component system, NtrC family, nitrogen regulation sensor histidine kinase NtrY